MESLKSPTDSKQADETSQSNMRRQLTKASSQDVETPWLSKEWLALAESYELMEELGSGSFGCVVKARHIATKTDVAIKLLRN